MITGRSERIGHGTQGHLLREGISMLSGAGIDNAENEAVWLLEHVLGTTLLALHLEPSRPVQADDQRRAHVMFRRRAAREPLQYLLGTQEFFGLEFAVDPAVLIPRPETELLVAEAVRCLAGSDEPVRIADIGTGSGCIAISLARALPDALIYATDRSKAALAVASRNAARHGVTERVVFFTGDLFEALKGMEGRLTAVVSNPPYIPDAEWDNLQPEVRLFEPRMALAGGADGLAIHRRLLTEAGPFLTPAGRLILEVGQGQAADCVREAGRMGYDPARIVADGAGIERIISLQARR